MVKPRERGRPAHPDVLTPAEWRVVEAVRHGLRNREIAAHHGVSMDAVKFHVANALQKLGMSSRRELRRWTGVRRDSHLFRKECPMGDDIKLGVLAQISRTVRDIDAARNWYGEMLGLTHLYSFGNLAFFDCGGVRLMLCGGEGGSSEAILYFLVDDVRAAHASLSARGLQFTHAPHMVHRHADGTEEWMAFLADNESRPLAIMSRAAAAATGAG